MSNTCNRQLHLLYRTKQVLKTLWNGWTTTCPEWLDDKHQHANSSLPWEGNTPFPTPLVLSASSASLTSFPPKCSPNFSEPVDALVPNTNGAFSLLKEITMWPNIIIDFYRQTNRDVKKNIYRTFTLTCTCFTVVWKKEKLSNLYLGRCGCSFYVAWR